MKTPFVPLVTSVLLVLSATGCVPMMIMSSLDHDNYSKYVQTTNALNTEREKSNLAPIHVLTFAEWHSTK